MFDIDQCRAIELRIQEALDQHRDPLQDKVVADHTSECAECERLTLQFIGLTHLLSEVFGTQDDFVGTSCGAGAMLTAEDAEEGISGAYVASRDSDRHAIQGSPGGYRARNMRWQTLAGALAATVLAIVAFEGRLPLPELPLQHGAEVAANSSQLNLAPSRDDPTSLEHRTPQRTVVTAPTDRAQRRLTPFRFESGPVTTPVSLVTCYELTSELPGIRPLRGSVDLTLSFLQNLIPSEATNPGTKPSGDKQPDVGGLISGSLANIV